MRWFDGKINSVKNSLIPYVLHGINEEIYDEIVERDDGYYLIVRCGTMPFTNVHNFSVFKVLILNLLCVLFNTEFYKNGL